MTLRKFFSAAASSVLALVGFAGVAHPSATIDLIWETSGTNETNVSSHGAFIQLNVILTAGPNGSEGGGVSVDFSSTLANAALFGALNTPSVGNDSPLPLILGVSLAVGSRVELINSICICDVGVGVGLEAGASHRLGFVTFFVSPRAFGTYEILSDAEGSRDGVLDGDGNVIPNEDITFNSAFLVISRPPGGAIRRQKSR